MSTSPPLAELTVDSVTSDASAALVIRDREVEWSYDRPGRDPAELLHTASVTKFVIGRCVASAVYAGQIESVDTSASLWLTEWADDERSDITLRHLMMHTSGLRTAAWPPEDKADPITRVALGLQPVSPPGEVSSYSNYGSQAVAEIVRRATGLPIDEYAGANIFEPLGITAWRWNRGPDGLPYGMGSLQLRPRDLARIGELSLAGGAWEGKRIFAAEWAESERRPGRAFGLMEMLIPEADVVVDLEGCEPLGAELEAAVRDLDGSTLPLNGASSLWLALGRRFGPAGVRQAFADLRRLAPKVRFAIPTLQAYGHTGDGGQDLWVVPSANAVAVRMRDLDERSDTPATANAFPELALSALLPGT